MQKVSTHKNKELLITQYYSKDHKGVDIGVSRGTIENEPFYFILGDYQEGKVEIVAYSYYLNGILYENSPWFCIKLPDNKGYRQFHAKSLVIKQGQKIKRGDLIGYSGNTGYSFGAHDHVEILENYKDRFSGIDPSPYILNINLNPMIPESPAYEQLKKILKYLLPEVNAFYNSSNENRLIEKWWVETGQKWVTQKWGDLNRPDLLEKAWKQNIPMLKVFLDHYIEYHNIFYTHLKKN